MKKPSFDPGLGQKLEGKLQRVIDQDGSFSVVRSNVPFSSFNPYISLISMTWTRFFTVIVAGFLGINALFALVYCLVGIEHLKGANAADQLECFLSAYYFSVHTFTTVGYGNMSPDGTAMNVVSILEIICGVLCIALMTGLLYGRFSRPSAKLVYSDNMVIAPFNSTNALMFRVANLRRSVMMELEAELMIMFTNTTNGKTERSYRLLNLERKKIVFLPLTWTLVHPIDEESPLFGLTDQDLKKADTQFLIMIKGFDDMFGQVVHSRYSYSCEDIRWGSKFEMAYHAREDGRIDLDFDKINAQSPVSLNS